MYRHCYRKSAFPSRKQAYLSSRDGAMTSSTVLFQLPTADEFLLSAFWARVRPFVYNYRASTSAHRQHCLLQFDSNHSFESRDENLQRYVSTEAYLADCDFSSRLTRLLEKNLITWIV